jgi:hypothetical protein
MGVMRQNSSKHHRYSAMDAQRNAMITCDLTGDTST